MQSHTLNAPLTHPFMVLVLAALLTALAGCKSEGPPDAWEDVDPEAQPTLFEMRASHPALADLKGLYLTQPKEEAVAHLKETYCKDPVRRESQYGDDAYFLGCRLKDDATLAFMRIGIWPRIGNRVATLEIQRKDTKPATVYHQFRELVGKPTQERLEPRMIEFITDTHRMFADWDSGLDKPAHIAVGLDPDWSGE
jgi:predicted small lipoprotein YifL